MQLWLPHPSPAAGGQEPAAGATQATWAKFCLLGDLRARSEWRGRSVQGEGTLSSSWSDHYSSQEWEF